MHNLDLKELVNLSNLCNFQLFVSNNKGNSSHQKLRNYRVAKTLMNPFILCKGSKSFKDNFSETIRYRAEIFTDN